MGAEHGSAGGEGARLPLLRRDQDLSAALAVTLLVAAIWAAIFTRGMIELSRARVLRPLSSGVRASFTVLVPARNEGEVIGRSVRALVREASGAGGRVVVIDDGSTDDTRAELSAIDAANLFVLEGRGPRPGECGKPAALAFAYESVAPSTEWLLFVDADVVLAPGALASLFAAQEASGADLVSVIPRVEQERAIEKLLMPSIGALVLAQFPPSRVARAEDPIAFANGQVILVRRSIYQAIGGHRAVIGEILEDVRLAERVKRAGGKLLVVDGRFIASTRMYAGWRELVEGWSKNLYLLLGGTVQASLRWIVLSVVLAWSGVLLALAYGWPLGIAAYAYVTALQVIVRAKGGAPPAWGLLAPIAALLTAWIMLRSMLLFVRKAPIAWKGRTYG